MIGLFTHKCYHNKHMSKAEKKVLLVEDDLQISKVYEIQLKKEGILAVLAHDGEEAMELFVKEKPDLIVLDLMLPKMDGFGVLEDVRKNHENTNIPIIVISNLGQKDDKIKAISLGATEYMIKVDHSIKEIVDKIKEHLDN